jgi:hypothetical protein
MKQDRKGNNKTTGEYVPDNGEFAIEIKTNSRENFSKKQETQRKAHDRRAQIRELQENRDW